MKSAGLLKCLQESIPRIQQLYTDETRGPFVCRCVVAHGLSVAAQQVVLRLSCTGGSFPRPGVLIWCQKRPEVLQELADWGMIANTIEDAEEITLLPEFRAGYQSSLSILDVCPWACTNSSVPLDQLEHYAHDQWNAVLHFLVGTVGPQEPAPAIVHFLLQTGLMQPDPEHRGTAEDAPLVITEKGYDFMLQDAQQQVWHFVSQYLQSLELQKKGPKLVREALLLLIGLSFATVGQGYETSVLTKAGKVMVQDLAHFGLLQLKGEVFYPTPICQQLITTEAVTPTTTWALSTSTLESALAHPAPRDSSHLAVLVQTNFQLCAYTTSELHVSMLALFCDVSTIRRLPNVVFMTISRDSVKGAFALGIRAKQILRFLEKHAHPKVRGMTGSSSLPSNVVDQIWLWDRERGRLKVAEVYQHQCLMAGEYAAVAAYAEKKGCLGWGSERTHILLLDYRKVASIEKYVRKWRAEQAGR